MTNPIRVLIADDQDLVRGALAALLNTEEDIDVVAEASTGADIVDLARCHNVDIALLDIEMPEVDGITAAERLAREVPECRSLIVTTFGRPGYVRRALAAGAQGFVVKDTPPAQLAEAIRRVSQGLRVVDPTLAQDALFGHENPLTEREIDVCRAALDGATVREIADALHLSPGTVRNHLSTVIGKTGAQNRHAAVHAASQNGWL
jgi:two-component system response regulator DesR